MLPNGSVQPRLHHRASSGRDEALAVSGCPLFLLVAMSVLIAGAKHQNYYVLSIKISAPNMKSLNV
jgi:hypothetical protein